MNLTDVEMEFARSDRFSRWNRRLKAQEAIPVFTLGLSNKNEFVLCACEEVDDKMLLTLLEAAVALQRKRLKGFRG